MSSSDGSPGQARPEDVSGPPAAGSEPWEQPSAGQLYPQQPAPGQGYPPVPHTPPAALPPGSYASGPYPAGPYASAPEGYRAPNNVSALVLTILSGIAVLFCAGVFVIPALVLGILGLTRQATDPDGSRRYSRWGWWAFGVGVVLTVIAVVAVVGLFFAFASDSGSGGTPTFDGY